MVSRKKKLADTKENEILDSMTTQVKYEHTIFFDFEHRLDFGER